MAWKKFTAESEKELQLGKRYLVQRRFAGDEPFIDILDWIDGWNCFYMNGTHIRDYEKTDVVAWQELPEPMREEIEA